MPSTAITACYNNIVKSGETCTIEAAIRYGIFDKKNYFDDTKILSNDILQIDKHINNIIDESAPYSLCTMDGGKAIMNCALSTKNPWKTLREPANLVCSVPLDIELPDEFSYDKTNTNNIIKPPPIFRYKSKVGYCQERWYDWFTIPDYHFGNKYMILSDDIYHPNNISKCFKPCNIGYVPRDNKRTDVIDKCVQKNYFQNGLYKNTFHYLPISLILLLGSTKKSLIEYYKFILDDIKTIVLNNDLILDETVYDILHTDAFFDNIYNTNITNATGNISSNIKTDNTLNTLNEMSVEFGLKKTIKNSIYELFKIPFDVENITVPDKNVIEASMPLITKSKIQQAYNICKKYHDLQNDNTKILDFNSWKTELAELSSQTVDDVKFKKQLVILKQACNITFNGKTEYSKNIILYNLNKDIDINKNINPPIEFIITKEERKYNISSYNGSNIGSNIDYNNDLTLKGTSSASSDRRSYDSASSSGGNQAQPGEITYTGVPHNRAIKNNYLPLSSEYEKYYKFKNFILIFIIIIVLTLLIFILVMLFIILTPYTTTIFNYFYIIFRNISVCFYDMITHLFGFGTYEPDIYHKKVAEFDLENATSMVTRLQANIANDKLKKVKKSQKI